MARRTRHRALTAWAAALMMPTAALGATAAGTSAAVTVDVRHPGPVVDGSLWGSNLLRYAPVTETVENPQLAPATRSMGIPLLRWPGGNRADVYDWKRNETVEPGRRVHTDGLTDLPRMIAFAQAVGAEPTITVNFGTMSASDAADLVELLNGPPDSPWGSVRASLGFPEPLDVRFFEIGNEEDQPHMWFYSWTAENPMKYFFGGDEERRGFYGGSRLDPVGAKGDFFASDGTPGQSYVLRFPPVEEVRVFVAASRDAAEQHQFTEWTSTVDLAAEPPSAEVFTVEPAAGVVRFGDGIHGTYPPPGSYILVEYTTLGHDGFLDFARAMRAAPSSVPIQIGAATLPFVDGEPIAEPAEMAEIFNEMDFYVRHQYNSSVPVEQWSDPASRRQIAADRVDLLESVYGRVRSYMDSLGIQHPLAIGITEWNIFLEQPAWFLNRTLEGGVIAAEWFARLLNSSGSVPVLYAEQFALHGGNLALVRTQTNSSLCPMAYVFQGFTPWRGARILPVEVDSPGAAAYDRTIPYVTAAAALAPEGDTVHVVLVNNAVEDSVPVELRLQGFVPTWGRLRELAAPRADANNDDDPDTIVLIPVPYPPPSSAINLPPHSVTFLELGRGSRRPAGRAGPGGG